ncbi:MAG: histidine--tRNA ligase [Bdellovibrionota bacterium]
MNTENSKKAFLSTQGYRGTRDFYPEDQRLRAYIYHKIHTVMKSFGYEEYDGPFVELLELYAAKSSEEIVRDQLYSFLDKGERHLAIRPEMTPTLARMVAAKQQQLQRPIRWYSIPTCMRFERPQRGRLREFDQLNVDIFGGNSLDEDIEVLLTIVEILKSLGASNQDFIIKLNNRALVNSYVQHVLHINSEKVTPLFRLLDKRDKLTAEVFYEECQKLNFNPTQIDSLEKFLHADLDEIISLFDSTESEGGLVAKQMKLRVDAVNQITNSKCVVFAPDIMRGFDYYTGMIFEVFDTHPENRRALCGGGRYDNLVSAFGGAELSGIGYGMGDVALQNFMEVHNLTPKLQKETHVSVIRFGESDRLHTLKLSAALRKLGLNVECCVTLNKFGKQIQSAEKLGVKVVVFCGETEMQNQAFAVKWLQTGQQEVFSFDEPGLNSFYKKFLLGNPA